MMSRTFGEAANDECKMTNDERRQRRRSILWERVERPVIARSISHAIVLKIDLGIEPGTIQKMLDEVAGQPWRTQGPL
jgi:hypothetical protein